MNSPNQPRVRYPDKRGVRIVCEARSHEPKVVQLGRINRLGPDATDITPRGALGTVATTGGWGTGRGNHEELVGDTLVERTEPAMDGSNDDVILAEAKRVTQHGRQRITFRCKLCGDCVQLAHDELYGVAYCLRDTPVDKLSLPGLRSVMLVAARLRATAE